MCRVFYMWLLEDCGCTIHPFDWFTCFLGYMWHAMLLQLRIRVFVDPFAVACPLVGLGLLHVQVQQ